MHPVSKDIEFDKVARARTRCGVSGPLVNLFPDHTELQNVMLAPRRVSRTVAAGGARARTAGLHGIVFGAIDRVVRQVVNRRGQTPSW